MHVEQRTAAGKSVFAGSEYYFCSAGCKRKFDANPAAFVETPLAGDTKQAEQQQAMIAEWENGRERSARYERELLPLASARTQATIGAYRGAKASIIDVLVARRAEVDVRVQALQLEMDTARVWAQLNFLLPESEVATRSSYFRAGDLP